MDKTPRQKTSAQLRDEEFDERLNKYNISAKKLMPIIVICVVVDMLGYMMIMPLLPFYAQSFGASDFTIGIITSLNAVTSLISGPFWGRLSDRYGRKPVLLVSQVGTLISFIILALANSTWVLMLSRVVDGLFGGQIPVVNAAIADVTRPETRSERMAVMAVSMTIGSIVGPMIGGYLGAINIVYPAYAASVMAIIAIVVTTIIFTETMPEERRRDLKVWADAKVATAKRLVLTRLVVVRLGEVAALTLASGMVFSSLSLILNYMYGATASDIGNIMTAMGVCTFIFGGVLMRHVKGWIGERRTLLLAISLLIAAYTIMPSLPTLASFLAFIVLFDAGNNFARPIVSSNLSRAVDEDQQGLISGYSTTVQSLSRAVAPLVTTSWLELGGLTVGSIFLSRFQMISATGVAGGLLFLCLFLVDVRMSPGELDDGCLEAAG